MEHTKCKLKAEVNEMDRVSLRLGDQIIADMRKGRPFNMNETLDLAEHLVLCWNSHDALLEANKMNVIEAKAALEARRLWKHGTSLEPVINGFIEYLQRIVKRGEKAIADCMHTDSYIHIGLLVKEFAEG